MPDVVVGAFLSLPGLHRQRLLGPVQGLDLGLLVDAEHDRVLRRVQIQPDHVGDLGDQLRVGGELERLRPPRLDPVMPPGPQHRRGVDPQMIGQQPRRPMGDPQPARRRAQRRSQNLGPVHRPRPPRPLLIHQTPAPRGGVTITPADHRRPATPTRSAISVFDTPRRPAAQSAPAAPNPPESRTTESKTPTAPGHHPADPAAVRAPLILAPTTVKLL